MPKLRVLALPRWDEARGCRVRRVRDLPAPRPVVLHCLSEPQRRAVLAAVANGVYVFQHPAMKRSNYVAHLRRTVYEALAQTNGDAPKTPWLLAGAHAAGVQALKPCAAILRDVRNVDAWNEAAAWLALADECRNVAVLRELPLCKWVAAKYGCDEDERGDLTEHFIRVVSRWNPFRGITFATFATRCLMREAWQNRRRPRVRVDVADRIDRADPHAGPAELACAREAMDVAATLPADERYAVTARLGAGERATDIARRLGVSHTTAATLVASGTAKLAAALHADHGDI